MVVPKASPKANKVAANAASPNGRTGRGSLRAALISILTVFHPKESYKQQHTLDSGPVVQTLLEHLKHLDQNNQQMIM